MRQVDPTNLAYTVFIKWDSGATGSGFQLNSGKKLYLVTAKHVLFDNLGNLQGSKLELICQPLPGTTDKLISLKLDMIQLMSAKGVLIHPNKDIAMITIGDVKDLPNGTFNITNTAGVTNEKHDGLVCAMKRDIKKIDQVLVGNDVLIEGYPSSLGIKDMPPQFDYNKPLLRKGIIANADLKSKTIILDCPAFYGNSGGPAMQIEMFFDGNKISFNYFIIGVVIQFIPYEERWTNSSNRLLEHRIWHNSGYSIAVSMDSFFEIPGVQ